jgi:transcriptional regulator with XRE-family HTH domain
LRDDAGLTIEEVAGRLRCSESKVSRIENGQIGASPDDVREMLLLYGTTEQRLEDLIQVAREERKKKWWHAYRDVFDSPYVTYEAAAKLIESYGGLLVPGLLQTKEYATAVLRALAPQISPDEVARRIEFRMLRQTILAADDPPLLTVVLDEAVLRRQVGGRDMMRNQLRRLINASANSSVTLQIVEFGAGQHSGLGGSFTLLHFENEDDRDLVYFETAIRSVVYSDDPHVVQDSMEAFERLRGVALSPDESTALLVTLTNEL